MIKRIIEISRQPVHLSVRLDQLIVQPLDTDKSDAKSIPCEDIGLLLLDHPQVTVTHPALATLMDFGAAVMVCGKNHLPAGLLVPLSDHAENVWRLQDQINATLPTQKRLWQQIVIAKVLAQAANLPDSSSAKEFLENLAGEVKSGDSGNIEAQAAKVYWATWLSTDGCVPLASSLTAGAGWVELSPNAMVDERSSKAPFRFSRDPDSLDILNVMLNYGYAVLRAAVARALVCGGLFPALGVHHRHRSNSFSLADDLMEPLRPMVDVRVRELYRRGRVMESGLDQPTKAFLLDILNQTVRVEDQSGPLMVGLHRYTASFLRCLRQEDNRLLIPQPMLQNKGG